MIMKETFTIKLTYEMSVDTDTGEILETKLISREVDNSDTKPIKKKSKKVVEDSDSEPKLYLEENKYRLNSKAVELLNLDGDSRLSIVYEQGTNGDIPVIGKDEDLNVKGGNKVTQSNTVAYRGAKHDTLAKYGTEFTLVAHPKNEKVFILTNDSIKVDQLKGDENVNIKDNEDFDLDLNDLVDVDDNVDVIDSNFFKL